jgi:hypothetical protein
VSSQRGSSIKIFLPKGTTDGLWVVDLSNWTGRALVAPRSRVTSLLEREELSGPGVYILIGPADSAAKSDQIYIGEADVLRTRLKQHGDKDFWTTSIIFVALDASLNKARIKYLESRLVHLATEADRSEVANSAAPKLPALSESDVAEVEGFLEEMLVIYPVLGVKSFEQVQTWAESGTDTTIFHLKGAETDAKGAEVVDGFVVFAGSLGRASHVPSIHEYGIALRQSLLADGTIVEEGAQLRFVKDHIFSSPSTAAMVLLGRTSNGRVEWKTSAGQTLKDSQDGATGS